MAISFKVLGGTLPDKRLCDSCRFGRVMKHADGTVRIICNPSGIPVEIRNKVVECNAYCSVNSMLAYEAERIGWVLDMQGKKIVGFVPPKRRDGEV